MTWSVACVAFLVANDRAKRLHVYEVNVALPLHIHIDKVFKHQKGEGSRLLEVMSFSFWAALTFHRICKLTLRVLFLRLLFGALER